MPGICPFLGGVVAAGGTHPSGFEVGADPGCVALRPAVSLSRRQLDLACLTEQHLVCPRFVRGNRALPNEAPTRRVRPLTAIRLPVLLAALVMLLSAGIAVGYLVAGGGLTVPSSSPALVALASQSPAAISSPNPTPASPSPSPLPSFSTSPEPSAAPTPPSASPSPEGSVEALFPEGGRWDHLVACPHTADCYVYTVQPNDTLFAIAATFHVPLRTVLTLNPQVANGKVVHVGEKITLPTPRP